MFGDHYPHIINFTEYLYGKDVALLSTEDYSRLRQTPFLIWSNKGVEAEKIDDIALTIFQTRSWSGWTSKVEISAGA